MEVFIRKPDVTLYPGIRVAKDTVLEYKTENVEQTLWNLILHTVTRIKGDGFVSTHDTTIYLNEGDVLIYEDEGRGYIKPVDDFMKISEAIEDLTNIKDLG